jgi:hypothetical protein
MKRLPHRPDLRHLVPLLTVVMSCALLAGPIAAQATSGGGPAARHGFHFSIGLGTASVSATCSGCDVNFFQNRIDGFSGRLQLGASVTPQLVIAGEFLGWIKNDQTLHRRIAALSVVLLGYPSPAAGFFMKAGFGMLRAIAENDLVVLRSDALMSSVGLGYDIPVGRRVKLTPYGTYIHTFATQTWADNVESPVPISPNAFQFGVALTVH